MLDKSAFVGKKILTCI